MRLRMGLVQSKSIKLQREIKLSKLKIFVDRSKKYQASKYLLKADVDNYSPSSASLPFPNSGLGGGGGSEGACF